jgi:hypothetical protein
MALSISKRVSLACCSTLIMAASACGDDGDGGTDPGPVGDYSVMTVSSGDDLDADGYEVRVNDTFAGLIGVNDSLEFRNRPVDTYSVGLADVATNCTVDGDNPRPLQVIVDSHTDTTFEVTCVGTAGVLRVVTSTSGEDPDDGYTLAVDGSDAVTIGANDTAQTADLATGEHTVRLGDMALNCRLAGDPERNVTVPSEDLVETKYEVFCTDRVGNLRLVTSTTGLFPDPDGYQVVIEIGGPIPIRSTAAKTVGSVAGGINRVHLVESSVADNCSVNGENPRSVDVPSGGLTYTVFDVACEVP